MYKTTQALKYSAIIVVVLLLIGFVIPEDIVIPVKGATDNDWNHETFWYDPWGTSIVHKGIDIFGVKNTPVIAASTGIVLFSGVLGKGGKAIAILGPKWRVHYYAHLQTKSVSTGEFVTVNKTIGTLGNTGNAVGKPSHLHYSIVSIFPIPWLVTTEKQGWKKMFFLNPYEKLIESGK